MMPWEPPPPSQVTTAEIATPEGLIRLEQVNQVVTWEDAADVRWRFTDANGHRHAYEAATVMAAVDDRSGRRARRRGPRPTHYPTLTLVIDSARTCLGNEGLYAHDTHTVEESHYECAICRLPVEPGHGPGSMTIPVSRTATLTEEQADPPPGWLDGYEGRVTWQGGVALGTRTRVLPWDEAMVMVTAQLARDRQAERDAEARRVRRALGYPPGFGEDL